MTSNWNRIATLSATLAAAASLWTLSAQAQEATTAPATEGAEETKKDEKKWDVANPPGDWGWKDVSIDVTEGTWISVDVSPDGSTLAFDLLGDIYTMPIGGGEATNIRSGIQWDMQPRFSPDGTRIAFTSDGGGGDNVWIMDVDGSDAKQVTKESFRLLNGPNWDPSGDYIVARKHFTSQRSLGAGEMWLYHVTGGAGMQMTKRPTEQKDVNEPVFSPDGKYLYYSQDATSGRTFQYNKDSNGQIYAIYRLDRATGEIERVTGGAGGAARPTPSPDGKTLAFVRRVRFQTVLFLRDLETGREWPIHDDMERDMQEAWAIHGVYPAMAWTPDSKEIVFWAGGGLHRIDVASKRVRDIPFHVADTRQVADVVRQAHDVAPEQFELKMLRDVEVSPDGGMVAYQALGHIYVKDLPDGAPRRLTSQNEHFEHEPSFSRDGKSIVYVTWSDANLSDVRVAPASGGEGRVVVPGPAHYTEPVFTPDGETIVYRKVGGGFLLNPYYSEETGVYKVSADGGEPVKFLDGASGLQFGAASDRVFYVSSSSDETSDTTELHSVGLDGKDDFTHFTSGSVEEYAVSPDGEWVAFKEEFKTHVAPMVPTGRTLSLSAGTKAIPVGKAGGDAGNYLHWSGDSSALHWSLGPILYSRELTDTFAFLEGAPEELPEPTTEGVDISFTADLDVPSGSVALVGARLVTMKGDEVIEDGVVVINGNTIAAIGKRGEVAIPEGALVMDVAGKTITPGFIDAHAHGGQGQRGIIPEHNWGQYANLAFGVTTIHDPSNSTETIFAAQEMQRAGMIRTPRIFSTGTILYGAAGLGYHVEINSFEDALFHMKRMQQQGAFSVKSYNQPRREQRQQVLKAARELGMLVVPEGGSTFMHNMTMIVDGHTGIEHNIPVRNAYDDVLQLWQSTKVGYTPTHVVSYGGLSGENYWYDTTNVWENEHLTRFYPRRSIDAQSRRREKAPLEEYNHISAAKICKDLVDRGIYVNCGAHGQLAGLAFHWEMWMMAQGGMTSHDALRTGTIFPAKHLGLDAEIGSLEVGKLADLNIFDANPLADIQNIETISYVCVNGRIYDALTMDQVGNHPDTVGSDAFGDGPDSLGIGAWWGTTSADAETDADAHTRCSCSAH